MYHLDLWLTSKVNLVEPGDTLSIQSSFLSTAHYPRTETNRFQIVFCYDLSVSYLKAYLFSVRRSKMVRVHPFTIV